MSEITRGKEKQPESGVSRRKFLAGSAMALGAAGLSLTAPGAIRPVNAAPSDETYVWLCAVTSIAFWIDGRQGFETAGKALGVKTEFMGPVEYDAVAQLKVLEEVLAKKTGWGYDFSRRPSVFKRADDARHESRHSRRNSEP